MGKKDTKRKHKDLDMSLIDHIAKLDPTKTNKMTCFLVERLKERFGGEPSTNSWMRDHFNPQTQLDTIIGEVIVDGLGGRSNIESLIEFSEHLEAGRIDKNDITTYKSWGDITRSLTGAQMKFMDKEMKKQTKIIHEDDTWLILKPLSVKAAQTYGMGTKWCTSMKHEPSYFYDYSRRGILIYTINKSNGRKFGFYSSENEFSVWDTKDKRVDSMETRLPVDLIDLIRVETDIYTKPVNKELFGEEAMKQYDEFYGNGSKLSMTFTTNIGVVNPEAELHVHGDMMEMAEPTTITMVNENTHDWVNMSNDFEVTTTAVSEYDGLQIRNDIEEPEPRGADTAFGNMVAHAGIGVDMDMEVGIPLDDMDMSDEVMEVESMEEAMEVPANTPFIVTGMDMTYEAEESVEHGTEEG